MNAVCFLSVNPEIELCSFANSIKNRDVFIILDNNNNNFNEITQKYKNVKFLMIDDVECSNKGFKNANTWGIKKTPTAWDKAFYYFSCINVLYEHVWFVEEDVFIYNQNAFENLDNKYGPTYDLLVIENGCKDQPNNWLYWHFADGKIDNPLYHAMICSCRCSKKLLQIIKDYALKNNELFYIEIMVNTLASHNNLDILCIDELSTICPKPPKGKRYRSTDKYGKTNWVSKDLPGKIKINYMYHPVKNLKLHSQWRNIKL